MCYFHSREERGGNSRSSGQNESEQNRSPISQSRPSGRGHTDCNTEARKGLRSKEEDEDDKLGPEFLRALHRAQDFEAETFVGGENAAMSFEFAQRGQGHAEVDGTEGASANDAFAPAFRIRDFFDLFA
jgi:hypothetical protein